jgi:F-type H+-transporting ATPase subunit epsilon
MAKTFHLEIVTPDGPTYKGEVESLVVPAWEGQLGVLPGHAAQVAVMKPGALRYSAEGKDEWLAISGGFVQIEPTKVVVLAETAELAAAIDTARAKSAAGSKQQVISQGGMSEDQVAKMQASLMKELVRMRVAEKARKG